MSNHDVANEAKKIIEGIRRHQLNSTDKLSNLEQQVADVKIALQKMTEVQEKPVVIESKNDGLKKFIKKDGSIRLTTENTQVHIKGYGAVNIKEEGLFDSELNHSQWHLELKDMCNKKNLLRQFCSYTPKTDAAFLRHLERAPTFMKESIKKSLYDGGSNQGAELVPDDFKNMLYMSYVTPSQLAEAFEIVPCNHAQVLIPRFDYGGRPYIKGAVTSDTVTANMFTASHPKTNQASIAIKGFAARYRVDADLLEDAAIQLLPALQQQIFRDLTDGYEDCMINGDTQSTHQDDGTAKLDIWNPRLRWGGGAYSATHDHRKNFDGLRRQADARSNRNTTILDGNAVSTARLVSGMALMGEYSSQDMMIVTSPEMFVTMLGLDSVITMDKMGSQATILSGSLAQVFGMPIIVSRYVAADMNASGFWDDSVKDKSGLLYVNRSSYKHYQRRGITVETSKDINSDAINVVATLRRTFATPDASTTKNVAYLAKTESF